VHPDRYVGDRDIDLSELVRSGLDHANIGAVSRQRKGDCPPDVAPRSGYNGGTPFERMPSVCLVCIHGFVHRLR
jgi:hypothetical protein